jgi:hypothetical protein
MDEFLFEDDIMEVPLPPIIPIAVLIAVTDILEEEDKKLRMIASQN